MTERTAFHDKAEKRIRKVALETFKSNGFSGGAGRKRGMRQMSRDCGKTGAWIHSCMSRNRHDVVIIKLFELMPEKFKDLIEEAEILEERFRMKLKKGQQGSQAEYNRKLRAKQKAIAEQQWEISMKTNYPSPHPGPQNIYARQDHAR